MILRRIILLPILLLMCGVAHAGDGTRDDVETLDMYRFGMKVGGKLAKGLKLDVEPEFRFNDGFDSFVLTSSLSYKTFGCIYWGAEYRVVCDRESAGTLETDISSIEEYDWEYRQRYAFDVSYKEKFKRLTPSIRLRYQNFIGEDYSDESEIRYRAKLEYNIRKCPFTPEISVEAFQSEEYEYMFSRIRYVAGWEYKLNKRSTFAVNYKFDFYMLEYKNAHIFTLGYNLSL